MTRNTMTLVGLAALAYYLWKRREADPGKQEVVALPPVDERIGAVPFRQTPLGPQEIQALVDGKGYLGRDGNVRYTETK